jgi:hypothetical protein
MSMIYPVWTGPAPLPAAARSGPLHRKTGAILLRSAPDLTAERHTSAQLIRAPSRSTRPPPRPIYTGLRNPTHQAALQPKERPQATWDSARTERRAKSKKTRPRHRKIWDSHTCFGIFFRPCALPATLCPLKTSLSGRGFPPDQAREAASPRPNRCGAGARLGRPRAAEDRPNPLHQKPEAQILANACNIRAKRAFRLIFVPQGYVETL